MKVSKINISNILGIEELEIIPGKVTEISGKNGSGKTSCLEAIKAALKGGHDATLLRKGAETGEVVLVLENGMRIIKTITAGESNIKLTHPEHGKVSKPMQFIGQLSDEISLNPIKFLECKADARADFLLEAMPLEANISEIGEIIAPALNGQKVDVPKGHALKSVDAVYDQLFTQRQDINRAAKEKKATVEQLSASLPEEMVGTDEIKASISEMETRLEGKKDILNSRQRDHDAKKKDLEHEADQLEKEKHGAADQEYAEALAKITEKLNQAKKEATGAAVQIRTKALNDWAGTKVEDPTIDELAQKISAARQSLEEAIRLQNTSDVVAKMQAEYDKLEAKSEAHTSALEGLKAYKEALLKNLPIAGISIENGKIFKDGIPFDTLNTASQVQIAVDLAKIRAKDLGLIVLDGCENLDSEHLKALEEAIAKTDLQMVITSVTDGELSVTTK